MFVLSAWLASGFAMADDGKQLGLAAPLVISEAGTRKIPSVPSLGQRSLVSLRAEWKFPD